MGRKSREKQEGRTRPVFVLTVEGERQQLRATLQRHANEYHQATTELTRMKAQMKFWLAYHLAGAFGSRRTEGIPVLSYLVPMPTAENRQWQEVLTPDESAVEMERLVEQARSRLVFSTEQTDGINKNTGEIA
jgi:hypothetical protein